MGNKVFLTSLILTVLLVSCDRNRFFDEYKSLPNKWNKDSIIRFEVNQTDSLQAYNLFINLRNTNDYKYSNIYLITRINYPNGKVDQDTLQYKMSYPNGEWMGVGMSDSKDSKLWYKKNFRFDEKGTYTFQIRQAMRKNNDEKGVVDLKGITEVGLRIENIENN